MRTETIKNKVNPVLLLQWLVVFLVPLVIMMIPTTELFTQPMKLFFVITTAGILILAF